MRKIPQRPPAEADYHNPYRFVDRDADAHAEDAAVSRARAAAGGQPLEAQPQPVARVSPGRVSKAEFRTKCRVLFRPYNPMLDRHRLRRHHRDFIVRNETRSPEERYKLYTHLQKYDLSQLAGLKTLFNREDDVLTEEKLRAVERLVDGD